MQRGIRKMISLGIYVLCSALGLVLIKMGINKGFSLGIQEGIIQFRLGSLSIIGMCLYVVSFLMSLLIMSKMNITYFYPLSAGLIYVLVCVAGVLWLGETIQTSKLIGIGLILAGIIAMNINSN